MTEKFDKYYSFMNDYTEFFEDVMNAETNKLEALLSNELNYVVSALTEYQTCIKKAQQYEQKRIDMCKEFGFENMAFSEISKHFDGKEKQQLIIQKNKLDSIVKNIQYMNRKSMEVASMQLQYFDELASDNSGEAHMYNSKGKSDNLLKNSNLFNTKV